MRRTLARLALCFSTLAYTARQLHVPGPLCTAIAIYRSQCQLSLTTRKSTRNRDLRRTKPSRRSRTKRLDRQRPFLLSARSPATHGCGHHPTALSVGSLVQLGACCRNDNYSTALVTPCRPSARYVLRILYTCNLCEQRGCALMRQSSRIVAWERSRFMQVG